MWGESHRWTVDTSERGHAKAKKYFTSNHHFKGFPNYTVKNLVREMGQQHKDRGGSNIASQKTIRSTITSALVAADAARNGSAWVEDASVGAPDASGGAPVADASGGAAPLQDGAAMGHDLPDERRGGGNGLMVMHNIRRVAEKLVCGQKQPDHMVKRLEKTCKDEWEEMTKEDRSVYTRMNQARCHGYIQQFHRPEDKVSKPSKPYEDHWGRGNGSAPLDLALFREHVEERRRFPVEDFVGHANLYVSKTDPRLVDLASQLVESSEFVLGPRYSGLSNVDPSQDEDVTDQFQRINGGLHPMVAYIGKEAAKSADELWMLEGYFDNVLAVRLIALLVLPCYKPYGQIFVMSRILGKKAGACGAAPCGFPSSASEHHRNSPLLSPPQPALELECLLKAASCGPARSSWPDPSVHGDDAPNRS